jgi:hypothetical protein
MVSKKDLIIVVLCTFCLTATLFMMATTRSSPGMGEYNPWADINDDGIIDVFDAVILAGSAGATGTPLTKASIQYDSGWIDITDMAGRNITVTHGLNITDWNDESIDVSITGKTSAEGELQRYVGLTGQIQGWNKTYGGTNNELSGALVKTVDGGYALAGYTSSFGVGLNDFWLVKTDASGNIGGFESGLAWIDSSANTVTLYRGATDPHWNFVRVRVWKVKESP